MSLSGLSDALSAQIKNPYAKLVLIALGDSCDADDGLVYCAWFRAAEMAGTTIEHVAELVDELASLGFITYPENPLEGEEPIYEATDFIRCYLVSALQEICARAPRQATYKKQPIPTSIRVAVYERDGDVCHYCGEDVTAATRSLDHKFPESKGGKATFENLVVCCRSCNSAKGAKTYEEFVGCHS